MEQPIKLMAGIYGDSPNGKLARLSAKDREDSLVWQVEVTKK